MPLRVCIFSRETLLHWAGYYVAAFRACCDTIAIGAATGPEDHDFPDWNRVENDVVRNDIVTDELDAVELLKLLPEGWHPDVVVAIQSGAESITRISELGCPTVYLSVDTWHDAREFLIGHQYDFVFLAQRGIVKYMRKAGCCRVFWLPLACDPERHRATAGEETHDIAFVGSTHFMVNRQRVARLKIVEQHFNLGFSYGLGCDDMARAYGRGKLIFNSSISQDVNMRVFEALATGKPLVTNRDAEANGLFDLFEDEIHLITYTDGNLVRQIQRCLDHPDWARAIGEAGRREVLEKHTYVHRVESLLKTLRDHMPDLGRRAFSPLKTGLRVAEFVPLGTRRILDLGMGLDSSRIALHRQGVRHVSAIALSEEALRKRGRSYDTATLHRPGAPFDGADFDAVLWEQPLANGFSLEYVFSTTAGLLVEGGRLLLTLEEEELAGLAGQLSFSALSLWLKIRGYQLLVWRRGNSESDYHLVVACHFACTPDEIVAMLYQEFPVNGVDTNPGVRFITGQAPDSPDVGHP